MSSFLTRNIRHTTEYNSGGIASLSLLDIRDFHSYCFLGDKLYSECFVESITILGDYIELDVVDECAFTENEENGIFKQELTTFIRTVDGEKLSDLLLASSNRYLVVFRSKQGRAYTFGSDGGAKLAFAHKIGAVGEVSGCTITLSKNSLYPAFELSLDGYGKPHWILENGKWDDMGLWTRMGEWKTD